MASNYELLAIAVLFASQILVISFYVPFAWQQYRELLFKRYPPESYPRLHPLPKRDLERKFAIFKPMYLCIGACASLALIGCLAYGAKPGQLAGLMQIFLLVELLPIYIALPLQVRVNRALRAMPPPSPRSAELRRWRLRDFISPLWIGLGFVGQALALSCAVIVYLHHPNTLGIIPTTIFSSGMLVVMSYALYGVGVITRADPYMSARDTFRARRRLCYALFIAAAALGAWKTFVLLYNVGLV
ncbi:MAG: hypothetical protein WBE91_12535, partial [Steroidobacteraceae bacterium]